jgi:outer membrane protein assembly factor BamE
MAASYRDAFTMSCVFSHFYRRAAGWAFSAAALLGLAACGSTPSWHFPYRIEVVQGNFVSKEQVEQLKPGMEREEVRDLLGTPMLTSAFHENRWDYVFTMKRQGVEPQQRKLTLFFKGDALEKFEGDTMPSETEFVAQVDTRRKSGKVPPLEASEAELDKVQTPRSAAPADAPGNAAPTREAPAAYPPLEPAKR